MKRFRTAAGFPAPAAAAALAPPMPPLPVRAPKAPKLEVGGMKGEGRWGVAVIAPGGGAGRCIPDEIAAES